jgi:tryptophan-rich sensory protein
MKLVSFTKDQIFLGIIFLVTFGNGFFVDYYSTFNKPWFAFPFWLLVLVWMILGVSLQRVFKMFQTQHIIRKQQIKLLQIGTWISYIAVFYVSTRLPYPDLYFLAITGFGLFIIWLMIKTYKLNSKITLKLIPCFIIIFYLFVVGLYIITNN